MVLLSFMICSAAISTVLADIPTTIILSGIGYTLLKENGCLPGKSKFGRSMMMGIPIAACLGGFATPVGSGINVLCINLLKNIAGQDVTFLQWTLIGAPLAVVLTLIAWFILTVMVKPEIEEVQGLDNVKEKRKELGSLTGDEKKFSVIFGITLLLWLTQTWTKLDLTLISLTCSAVFFLPKVDLIDWKKAVDATGWAGLLIVGASNALAMILSQQGSAEWISNQFLGGLVGSSMLSIMLVVSVRATHCYPCRQGRNQSHVSGIDTGLHIQMYLPSAPGPHSHGHLRLRLLEAGPDDKGGICHSGALDSHYGSLYVRGHRASYHLGRTGERYAYEDI